MTDYRIQFENKPLSSVQTLAEMFVLSREAQKLTIEEIALDLQISPFYLEALEKGAYSQLPCAVYTRNFVKGYGQCLGLTVSTLVKQFEHEWTLFEKHQQPLLAVNRQSSVSGRDLWRMPRWIRWVGATLAIVAIMSYFGTELYSLREAPGLVVYSPSEEVMTEKQLIEIEGKADPEVALTINDQTILSDGNGNFKEMVT